MRTVRSGFAEERAAGSGVSRREQAARPGTPRVVGTSLRVVALLSLLIVVAPGALTAQAAGGDTLTADTTDSAAVAGPVPDTARTQASGEVGAATPSWPLFGRAQEADTSGLEFRLRGRSELGGDWSRFRPCDEAVQVTCSFDAFPRITPDLQIGLTATGSVLERFFVDVDYDQNREFSAANNIQIRYVGQEDEFLREVEVGDVRFVLPESRFLTRGIPAGNLGLRAVAGVGPVRVEGVWAQQRGSLQSAEFRLVGFGDNRGFVQSDTLIVDDADYVTGQFFFVVDPRTVDGFPALDVLALGPESAPASEAPGPSPIQLYRFENDAFTRQQVEGYIQAEAVAGLGADTIREAGWWRALAPGTDYDVHPNGLFVALRRPLRRDEMLAVTYVAASGDTVGTYNPERIYNAGGLPRLRLLRASSSQHQPGRPSWDYELHGIYRVSGSNDVDPTSVRIQVSLGELSAGGTFKRTPTGSAITFLKLFGLDEASPVDEVDRARLYKPAEESGLLQSPVAGTFLVFPTLRPFLDPPPLPSLGLDAEQTKAILGSDGNATIYEHPDPFERASGALYRLTIEYTVRAQELTTSFSLGGVGIRDGSERIYAGGRLLERDRDYEIDYDLGEVRLLDPTGAFAAAPDPVLRATWEEKSVFEIAPVSVFGLNARYDLGERGSVNLVGLYQSERDLVRRPQLGVEPSSILLAGLNADLTLPAPWLDRAFSRIPGYTSDQRSELSVRGELALSLPNPNTSGDVFLDDFDAANELLLPRLSTGWRMGSAPAVTEGAEAVLPPLDAEHAATLSWQHTWIQPGIQGDSVFLGFFPAEEIDRQIEVVGSQSRESALLVALGGGGGERFDRTRFRSMTTVLSPTGLDLSKSEFLEFYAADGDSITLVIDLGTVSEDAFFVDEQGRDTGVRNDGESWGVGRLDQEADPRRGQIWSDARDQVGVWGEACLAEPARIYPIADVRANCTRGNGRADTEDLDGDGVLDTQERVIRYVVPLDPSSPFLVRSRQETGTAFQLYRVPLHGPEGINVQGLFSEADWRGVKNLRLTLSGPIAARLILARFKIVGSQWVRRGGSGVLRGIGGDTLGTVGQAAVSSVSRITRGASYEAPPGVLDQLDDPASAVTGQGIEFSERSLGIHFDVVAPGERVEVFNRFPQRPRNFLSYGEARLWAVAVDGNFGLGEPLEFFFKVGSDSDNFYLYRTRLPAPPPSGSVSESDWLPQIVVDFDRWLELRRQAETELILRPPGPGDPPIQVWSADSTYAVVLQDRSRAPVLAAVREMSIGVYNGGGAPVSGEVWVDELRLAKSVRDIGVAGHLNVGLTTGGLFETELTISNESPFFRQLEDAPTYRTESQVSLRTTFAAGELLPETWGIEAPITVTRMSTGQNPVLLAQSDIRASELEGLRRPDADETRVSVALRKVTASESAWGRVFLDAIDASVSYGSSGLGTVTSDTDQSGIDARLGYNWSIAPRSFGVVPGALEGVVRAILPESLEERVLTGRLQWTPELVSIGTAYSDRSGEVRRFDQIVSDPLDETVVPLFTRSTRLDSSAEVRLRPLRSLTASVALETSRDLLPAEETVSDSVVVALLRARRRSLAGMDLGWETGRNLRTGFAFRPRVGDWLRGDFTVNTRYRAEGDAAFVDRLALPGDTVTRLQRNVDGGRDAIAQLTLVPAAVVVGLADSTTGGVRFFQAMNPVQVTWRRGVGTRFNRQVVSPDAAFQFGTTDLDGYRFLDGETSALLTDRETWTASTGFRFPGVASLTVNYQQGENETLDRRSERSSIDRNWPNLRFSMDDVPLPFFARGLVRRMGLSTGYSRVSRDATFGGASLQDRSILDRRVPVDLSVSWAGVVNTSYRGSFGSGVGNDATGETDRTLDTHAISLQSAFVPPFGLAERLARPVQVSLQYQLTHQTECRTTPGGESCVPFIDQLNRNLNLTLDSWVSDFHLGVQFGYVDRKSFVGLRDGTRSYQLILFGQFDVTGRLFANATP